MPLLILGGAAAGLAAALAAAHAAPELPIRVLEAPQPTVEDLMTLTRADFDALEEE